MPGTYRANGGEGWNLVARNTTGNDLDASTIERSNPGVRAPIQAGTLLQIPGSSDDPITVSSADLEIMAGDKKIETFDGFSMGVSIDAISKAGFTIPNEPQTRSIFVPLSDPNVIINARGKRIFSGRADCPSINNSPSSRILDISCYSSPGILEKVAPPLSAYPLEWTGSNLVTIANDLCQQHGVSVVFDTEAGAVFERVNIEVGENILSFLAKLAMQRGQVITSDEYGELIFQNGVTTSEPVARFETGITSGMNVSSKFDDDKYYSSVTGYIPAKSAKNVRGESFTVDNPYATDIVRPYTFVAENISPGELETAVNTVAGRMFAGVFALSIELPTWYSRAGGLFWPKNTVWLKSPDDYVADFYMFLISDVEFTKSTGVESAAMKLVLPGVYSGKIPETMPWQ